MSIFNKPIHYYIRIEQDIFQSIRIKEWIWVVVTQRIFEKQLALFSVPKMGLRNKSQAPGTLFFRIMWFYILFCQELYWNPFTSPSNTIVKWGNSALIIYSVCRGLQDRNLQIDWRNVDIYTVPRSCYNHCHQYEFVRILFYVLVKIPVAKKETEKV